MPTRLADTRTMTLDDAIRTFNDLAAIEINMGRRTAQAEARIARIKADHEADIAADVAARDQLAAELRDFIMAHPQHFVRPRAVQTDFGRFGRRSVSNVQVDDEPGLIRWALENGHLDVIKVTQKPVLPALAKRLRSGDTIPGVSIIEGEEAFYTVDKALIDDKPPQKK